MLSTCDEGSRAGRGLRGSVLVALMLALSVVMATPAAADDETHCVIDVLDVLLDGEFVVSQPICFATLGEVMEYIGAGDIGVEDGPDLFAQAPALNARYARQPATSTESSTSYSSVIGIHFTGRSGTGSSVTVTGSNCSGGYWNTSSSWRNVISSSYNGCLRLAHYSQPSISGTRYDTYGTGQTDSIYGSMDNNAESIRYLSS